MPDTDSLTTTTVMTLIAGALVASTLFITLVAIT